MQSYFISNLYEYLIVPAVFLLGFTKGLGEYRHIHYKKHALHS